jgi:uncharacterized protein YjbJ (UPF0337 family)
MVDKDSVEGFARDIGGKVHDAVGDAATQFRGRANQAAGAAQELYGQAADEVKNYTADQPVGALLMAMGVGVTLGYFLGRR